jgi:GNAT superfamily N-acetyltransferase
MALGYVRPARPGDAVEIARIQLATWRLAFRRILPRHVLDKLDEDWVAGRWRDAILAPPSAQHRVLVAVEQADQSYLVGFAASGPADEDSLAPDEDRSKLGKDLASVTELLVEPRWGRRGHGSRLLAASVDLWREDGFASAVAWVYDQGVATRAFLTSAGWEPDGATRALDVDDLLVPQLRLHVSLTNQLHADQLDTDRPHTDRPQADQPQADQPQADQPQADQPQADQPQANQPQRG